MQQSDIDFIAIWVVLLFISALVWFYLKNSLDTEE